MHYYQASPSIITMYYRLFTIVAFTFVCSSRLLLLFYCDNTEAMRASHATKLPTPVSAISSRTRRVQDVTVGDETHPHPFRSLFARTSILNHDHHDH